MLYVLVYHQYSFVKEIGPPQPQHTWKWTKDVSVVMCRVCVCAFLVIFLVFVHSDQFIVHPVSTSIEHQSESIGHEGHLLGSSRTFQYVRRWGTFLVGFMGTSQIDE